MNFFIKAFVFVNCIEDDGCIQDYVKGFEVKET